MTTILITGGARGIGLELARAWLAAGAQVIVAVRDPAKARALLPAAEAVALDVADDASVRRMADGLAGRRIDILVNNAGVLGPARQSTGEMDFAGFLDALNVNTLGPLRVTQALVPNLKLSTRPRVVVVSSRMGSMSYAKSDQLAYRASKAAVNKVVQGLATDLARDGIAVISLHPGWVRTDMGGPGADIDAAESAAGVKAVADALDLAGTGRFVNYDGAAIDW